jgi:hypothetical protein
MNDYTNYLSNHDIETAAQLTLNDMKVAGKNGSSLEEIYQGQEEK